MANHSKDKIDVDENIQESTGPSIATGIVQENTGHDESNCAIFYDRSKKFLFSEGFWTYNKVHFVVYGNKH